MKVLKRAGLLSGKGIVLCQTNDARFTPGARPGLWRIDRPGQLITHDGPEHVFAFAPTRRGKGIGTRHPHAPQLEALGASSTTSRRSSGRGPPAGGGSSPACWRFEPTAPDSVRFNPLLEIRRGTPEVRDVQNIADILVDPTGEQETARSLEDLRSHACSPARSSTSSTPRTTSRSPAWPRFLSNPAARSRMTLQRMLATRHLPSGPHPVVAQAAREMLNKSENELSGVVSTAMTCLGLYSDPVIARNTAGSATSASPT